MLRSKSSLLASDLFLYFFFNQLVGFSSPTEGSVFLFISSLKHCLKWLIIIHDCFEILVVELTGSFDCSCKIWVLLEPATGFASTEFNWSINYLFAAQCSLILVFLLVIKY